jgi:hypothetical protein
MPVRHTTEQNVSTTSAQLRCIIPHAWYTPVGAPVGSALGRNDGAADGTPLGATVVGAGVGGTVGACVGASVGEPGRVQKAQLPSIELDAVHCAHGWHTRDAFATQAPVSHTLEQYVSGSLAHKR